MGDHFRAKKKEILVRSLKCAKNNRIKFLRLPPLQKGLIEVFG